MARYPSTPGCMASVWAAPHTTVEHLFLEATRTSHILVALRIEGRMLTWRHDCRQREYCHRVPELLPQQRCGAEQARSRSLSADTR
jgi:hypothetical protein